MYKRSTRQFVSMLFGLAALASGCVGAVEQSDAEDLGENGASVDAPSEVTLDQRVGGVRRDAGAHVGGGATLQVSGRQILDTCGQPWVARGMEQITGSAFTPNTLQGLAQELVKTGSNAVRLLPRINELKPADIDGLLKTFAANKVVVYISPGDRTWFNRPEIKEVLLRHEKGLIIDAFQEPDYNDVPRWIEETKAAIAQVRGYGYRAPVTVLANQYGRDLPAALQHGQEIVDADPRHNTIVGWQAYWGKTGWYQKAAGMSLTQGVEHCAKRNFPMQLGIDLNADPGSPMDYAEVMKVAEREGMGWLWWNFWNQWDSMGNNASHDGTATNLTPTGRAVVSGDPNSIKKTARKACFR